LMRVAPGTRRRNVYFLKEQPMQPMTMPELYEDLHLKVEVIDDARKLINLEVRLLSMQPPLQPKLPWNNVQQIEMTEPGVLEDLNERVKQKEQAKEKEAEAPYKSGLASM
jgi:hypothetical protein